MDPALRLAGWMTAGSVSKHAAGLMDDQIPEKQGQAFIKWP